MFAWPSTSFALSLGEARVISTLDAPLEAEIDVLDASPEELAALSVEIPSREVFVRYGVARPGYLETARIAAGRGRDGRTVLQLRTRAKVTDAFLTVLIVADWGRGRVLREFNLVIDRQVLAPQPTLTVPEVVPQATAERAASVEREPVAPASAADSKVESTQAKVARGDTLLKFARDVANRGGVSIAQAAIAVYEANPQAFGASMHELRSGAVLRLPTAEELARMPRARALSEYAKQNATWRNRGGAANVPNAGSAASREPAGRLRLVAPTEAAPAASAERSDVKENASANGRVGTERNDAARGEATRGEATPAERPSGERPSDERLAALERELAESTRLLELRSRELAALQAKVSEANPTSSSVDLTAALARLWWLWALLIGVVVGLVFELARRARIDRDRELALEPAPSKGFAEVREPVVSMPAASVAAAAPAVVASPVIAPPPPIPAPPLAPPAVSAPPFEDFEGDPPPLDETGSRLDLARAYIEMGDPAAARAELEIVLREGDAQQRLQAQRLIESLRR